MKKLSAFIWLVFATSTVFAQVTEVGNSKSADQEVPSYAQRLFGKEVYRVMRSQFIFDETRPVLEIETVPVIESEVTWTRFFSHNRESRQCIYNQNNYRSRIYHPQLVALENCQFLRTTSDLQPQKKASIQVVNERGGILTVESGVFNVGNGTVCGLRVSHGSRYGTTSVWAADPVNCPQTINSAGVREEYAP
jgi:hypothetical protein